MDKGRSASAIWPADEAEAGDRGGAARTRATYLRMVPESDAMTESKAAEWINERGGRRGGSPLAARLPSAQAWAAEEALSSVPTKAIEPVRDLPHLAQSIIRPWAGLLEKALEKEVFPRLIEACRSAPARTVWEAAPSVSDLDAFVDFILADDMQGAHALVDSILQRSIGRAALLDDLFAPTARRLGVLWEQDLCDFATVTLGIIRLDQMMHETEGEEPARRPADGHDRRALLTPVPGEQHSFGVSMVADLFRRNGWHVWSSNAKNRPELLRLVRREAFHIIGFSAATDRLIGLLPSCIRAVRRASRNPGILVLVGGKYFIDHPGEAAAVGADAMARDAGEALGCANKLVSDKISVDCQASP